MDGARRQRGRACELGDPELATRGERLEQVERTLQGLTLSRRGAVIAADGTGGWQSVSSMRIRRPAGRLVRAPWRRTGTGTRRSTTRGRSRPRRSRRAGTASGRAASGPRWAACSATSWSRTGSHPDTGSSTSDAARSARASTSWSTWSRTATTGSRSTSRCSTWATSASCQSACRHACRGSICARRRGSTATSGFRSTTRSRTPSSPTSRSTRSGCACTGSPGSSRPDGRFFATYFEAPKGHPLDEPLNDGRRWTERNAFFYYRRDLKWAARSAGCELRYIGDWGHPAGQRMVEFRRPARTAGRRPAPRHAPRLIDRAKRSLRRALR